MKNPITYGLFTILFFSDYLTNKLNLPGIFVWIPEIFYACIAIVVILKIIERKSFKVPLIYIFIFMCFLYVALAGIAINEISILTIIAGIRTYFKYIPLFLLPFAFDYSEHDIKKQFIYLLFLGLIQVPLVVWQKFGQRLHPDFITGTLNISNSLSILMIAIVLMLLSLYLKKLISIKLLAFLSLALFLPTTLNETKVTPILLTVGFIALLFLLHKELSIKQLLTFSGSGALLLLMFISIYNILYTGAEGTDTYAGNLSQDKLLKSYNFTGYKADPNAVFNIQDSIIGEYKTLPKLNSSTGRIDSMLIPLEVLYNNDIVRLFIGFGIGNVHSARGKAVYIHLQALKATQTTISQLIWETGLLGLISFVSLFVLIAKDTIKLSASKDKWGAFSAGWFAVTIMLLVTLGYTNLFAFDELFCLFLFFSGLIIARLQSREYRSISVDH